jgi:hypothetical protein
MNLENEILQLCFDVLEKEMTPLQAQKEILRLFDVVGALAEQLCPKCGSDNIESSDKENDNECNYCGFIWA